MNVAHRPQAMFFEKTSVRHEFECTPLPDIDAPAMLRLEGRSVTDGDNRGARQPLTKQPIDHALGWLVERGRGFIEKQPIGFEQDTPNDSQSLLFAERELLLPMGLFVEALAER